MTGAPPPPPVQALARPALFLDFDGTLVGLAEHPDLIRVPPRLPGLLRRLADALEGRVALLTGRALADLERHVDAAGIAAAGSHGLERRTADATQAFAAPAPAGLDLARAALRAFATGDSRLVLEEKPASLALHYRQAPEREGEALAVAEAAAAEAGLLLQPGKMVVELRPAGADKGDALRALMAEPPFAGAVPVAVGDDFTDEHAFRAAAELGGFGVLVGPDRDTQAAYRLSDIGAVHGWLEAAANG